MIAGAPNVYFIDDSATMREVIKIAFRRENINVLACHDAANALAQMEQLRPDVVISDVIMPDKDGYEVCEYIKRHPDFGTTPVILMSGVVNRAVAERASAVKADELIRKPFQPQDLISRVRQLLNPRVAVAAAAPPVAVNASAALSSIFAVPAGAMTPPRPLSAPLPRVAAAISPERAAAPSGITAPPVPRLAPPLSNSPLPNSNDAAVPAVTAPTNAAPVVPLERKAPAAMPVRGSSPSDSPKLKLEILRLQGLVRKLQSELEAEREYSHALEAHIKTLQESE